MTDATEAPRVLMISDVYFPRINGVSTSIQTFRRDLARLGWPTWLVAPEYALEWPDDDLTLRISSRSVPLDPEDRLMTPRELLRTCRKLAGDIELIHIQTPFLAHWVGVKLAREFKIRTVETYHTHFEQYFHHYAPFLPRAILQRIARRITRAQCNAVDSVISPSEPMAAVLRDYGVQRPIEVIATGLALERFEHGDGSRFREQHGIAADRPVALHVGRVAFEKSIEFIVDMFANVRTSIPDALLIIAGEGPALGSLRARVSAAKLDDNVMFVGYLDREGALLDCYRSANAFVFASNTETQGLVILEAMAVGTPVVSTAVMGTKDILEKGEPGAIVVPEDRNAFSDAVIRVLSDRALQQEIGAIGRRFVQAHWSSEATAARTIELYRRLSGRSTPQPNQSVERLRDSAPARVGRC